jgi:peroxiredoxin
MLNRILNVVVNLAILGTCALIAVTIVRQRQQGTGGTFVSAVQFKPGDRAETIQGVDYRTSGATLLLYVRSSCHFCTASMPFYRRLHDSLKNRHLVQVVAVSPEDTDVTEKYLQSHQVDVEKVAKDQGTPKSTPTLLLVDSGGVIQHVWLGQQDEVGEKSILAAVM